MSGRPQPTESVVTLSGRLEIRDVADVHELLAGHLQRATPLSIDLGAVSAMDTAGAQLLLAVKREATRRGLRLGFFGQSPELERALELLGMRAAILEMVSP
jgi:anti-sigma B factor antagonist